MTEDEMLDKIREQGATEKDIQNILEGVSSLNPEDREKALFMLANWDGVVKAAEVILKAQEQ